MDGAMGTQLLAAGVPAGSCLELLNLTRPELVQGIHAAYVAAGARCLLTNTFQANPNALARFVLENRTEEIIAAGVALARKTGGDGIFVLGDIGPAGSPLPAKDIQRMVAGFAGVDALLLETCSNFQDLEQIRGLSAELPLLFSATFLKTPDGFRAGPGGHSPGWFASRAREQGIAALGVNCGRDIGMAEMIEIVRQMRQETDLPLFARPNAGTPIEDASGLRYPRSPEQMACQVPELVAAGATLIGGCCGTTPATIAAFRQAIEK